MLPVTIRKTTFHPTDKIFLCQLPIHTLISFCHSLIFPLLKILIGYLHQQKCIDYLSPMLAQTIKSEIESVEKNISEMLFKLAVEQAKLSNVVAATNKIDKVSLSALNNLCAEEVARNNGIITFEDAYKFQRG